MLVLDWYAYGQPTARDTAVRRTDERSMKLLHKVALVAAAVTLILSVMSLVRGEFHDAALGVFVAACALFTNFDMWPIKPLWGRIKS